MNDVVQQGLSARPRTFSAPLGPEPIQDVEALIAHAIESGLDKDGATVGAAVEALALYRQALLGDSIAAIAAAKEVLRLHGQLATLAAATGVSGRTIRSSAASPRYLLCIRLGAVACLTAAVATELAAAPEGTDPVARIAAYAVPFCWGAIGAIMFLMRTITDRASELAFDARKLQGLPERVLLGALCGTITVNLFGVDGEGMTRAGTAFLVGLGTKAVYAAFEAMVNAVAERVGGKSPPGA